MKIIKSIIVFIIALIFNQTLSAQDLKFEKVSLTDSIKLANSMQILAKDFLQKSEKYKKKIEKKDLFRIEILAKEYSSSIKTIQSIRKGKKEANKHPKFIQYQKFAEAKIKQQGASMSFIDSYSSVFSNYLQNCTDGQAYSANLIFTTYDDVLYFTNRFKASYEKLNSGNISYEQTLALLKDYFLYYIYDTTETIVFNQIKKDENRRYLIYNNLLITTVDSIDISAIVVRKKETETKSTILNFTIYSDASNLQDAILAASKGYIGVFATSRGKGLSKSKIEPYKHEHSDVYAVIDWISKQPWSNGKVGMYGGSYGGFTQWASMKDKVHPALKTIVPLVSAAPGIDVPMENNVFHNFSYSWIPYVTNNTSLDNAVYNDRNRWGKLQTNWFNSGKPYIKMDSIDGIPNKLFQEWISHPSYDFYWQNMIPYKNEFAHIEVPILTITGYYDDGQRGAMYYYNEHLKYKPNAEHYLLIGPYDHWGAQTRSSPNLRGYQIDPVANINVKQSLVFDWFDYILKGKEKPAILKDKVNFQVMGTNKWFSKPSIAEMSNDSFVFYLGKNIAGTTSKLVNNQPKKEDSFNISIDFANRSQMNNADYYPWPIIKDSINLKDGLVFMSEPLKKKTIINGSFSGKLVITANKKDFDFAVSLYELTTEGKYYHLSYYIGRASYAANKEKRELLVPDKQTIIAFNNTRIVSKKLSKGSRIVIVLNGNKNPYVQINYGTGKDVSNELIDDATIPLELKINSESSFEIPIWKNKLKE